MIVSIILDFINGQDLFLAQAHLGETWFKRELDSFALFDWFKFMLHLRLICDCLADGGKVFLNFNIGS